jgi:hypothetical protein
LQFRSSALVRRWVHGSFVYGLFMFGMAVNVAQAKDPPVLSLSVEHFRDTAEVKNNPGDGTTTVSTEKGFIEHTGPLRMVWNDEFLRGVIDRKTGQRSFQVYTWLIYSGAPRSYVTAKFETPSGTRSVPTSQLGRETANCAVGECSYTDRIGFNLDAELLRQLAAQSNDGKPRIWHFTLVAKSGPEYAAGLSTAEVAGFLAKVDEVADAPPVSETTPAAGAASPTIGATAGTTAVATSLPLKFDFGIGVMPVAASEDQPDRAGLLVVAVQRGSTAHKSGIIVGDILYEFDGQPLKALPDLKAAIAGCAANSVVAIKLYRGTERMAIKAQF